MSSIFSVLLGALRRAPAGRAGRLLLAVQAGPEGQVVLLGQAGQAGPACPRSIR